MTDPQLPSDVEFERDGYGTIINTTNDAFRVMVQAGDNAFRGGQYIQALHYYVMAIQMDPISVNLKISRAETLICLGRCGEAHDIFRNMLLDYPSHDRLNHRAAVFYMRTGIIHLAQHHVRFGSPDIKEELKEKIEKVEDHLINGRKERDNRNWSSALKAFDSMIEEGVDISQPVLVYRAEMLLKLGKLEQAEETIKRAAALEANVAAMFRNAGMPPLAHIDIILAQIDMELGRFDSALAAADRAHNMDKSNREIASIHTNVHQQCEARLADSAHMPR